MLTIDNPKKFDWANMDLSDCCEGNAMDTYFTLKLFDLIMEKLEGQPVMKLLENVVMPSLETFAEMEYNGLDVDLNMLGSVGKQLRSSNMEEEDFLYTCKGVMKTDNLSSIWLLMIHPLIRPCRILVQLIEPNSSMTVFLPRIRTQLPSVTRPRLDEF